MTVVHNHPHPLSQRYVKPSNNEIAKKFGIVRVEDWDDRVSGITWLEQARRGGYPQAEQYRTRARNATSRVSLDSLEVVRCHTQSTGELVYLHDDWLKDAQVIA